MNNCDTLRQIAHKLEADSCSRTKWCLTSGRACGSSTPQTEYRGGSGGLFCAEFHQCRATAIVWLGIRLLFAVKKFT
ncbi:MAG: hypothetical protein GDA45_01925 [Chromatiales bacterium]|nr:hypothetical protein [Chromatiales bacterium]